MRSAPVACALALALLGCKPVATPEPPKPDTAAEAAKAVDVARSQVRAALRDPESARFRGSGNADVEIAAGKPVEIACGYVNARNGFGGYTGEQPWYRFTFWDGSTGVCVNKLEDCNYLIGNMDEGAKACLARVS